MPMGPDAVVQHNKLKTAAPLLFEPLTHKQGKPCFLFDADTLKAIRESKGWSLRYLGERTDIVYQTIWNIETGKKTPSFDIMRRLGEALEVIFCLGDKAAEPVRFSAPVLEAARVRVQLSARGLGAAAKVSHETIYKLEKPTTQPIKARTDTIERLAKALKQLYF